MDYVIDTHSHTLASGHAYSTIREMAAAAANKGIQYLGITEHAPNMPGTCHDFYFSNLRVVDRTAYGVELLLGVELNILNFNGTVDLPTSLLQKMDIAIASIHPPCFIGGTVEQNTQAYINAMKNPYVNIIGHPDDKRFQADMEALVLASKEHKVLLELNNSSLNPEGARKNPVENDITMLEACKKYGVPIVIGSDAHTDTDVGRHDLADVLLKQLDFPMELILNYHPEEFKKYINRYKYQENK